MILTVFRASRTTRIAPCATEIALRDENCEVHNKNRVACDAIRLLLDGVNLLLHEQRCIWWDHKQAYSSAFRISSSILTWLEIESAGWVVEHWGCVLVSSSLKRRIRPLWNSLLYNYLALYSGRSRGGAWGACPPSPPLVLDQNEAQMAENIFFETAPPPYLRVWMTGPPLSEGLDPPLL